MPYVVSVARVVMDAGLKPYHDENDRFPLTIPLTRERVPVFQIGQKVETKVTPGFIGEVVGVVVRANGASNEVRWPGGLVSPHPSGSLMVAFGEGER